MKRSSSSFQAPEWQRDRVRAYALPPSLVEVLRGARGGAFDVLVTMDPIVISPDPEPVAAVEAVLKTAGVLVEYANRPSERTGRGRRASLYSRDLAKTEGVRRLPEMEADQAALRQLLVWAEANDGAVLGTAKAMALLPKPGTPDLPVGYLLVRETA